MSEETISIDTRKLLEKSSSVDVLRHPSESKTVTTTTSLTNASEFQEDNRSLSELAKRILPESFESIIVDSVLRYCSTIEHKQDVLNKDVADVTMDDKEAHEVIKEDLHEATEKHDVEKYQKVSIKSSNVSSEFNLSQVDFI